MLKFIRKIFNRRKSVSSVHEVSSKDFSKSSPETNENHFRYNNQPRRFDIELSSQDDEDSCCEDLASSVGAGSSFPKGLSENDEMIEMKSDDRARRQEIIETLIAFGVISYEEGKQISDTPYVRLCNTVTSSPRCKGFVLVNNFLRFPPYMNFSGCFLDYLNFRCQNGEILSRLLARKVFLEEDDDQLGNEGTEKSVFDLLRKRDWFYSFCMGKLVSIDEFDHCSQCLVCFEHSFWCCKKCGTSTARLCQLCNPALEAKCNVCRQPLVIDDEDQETFVTTSSESLQSLSQLEDFHIEEEVHDEDDVESWTSSSYCCYNQGHHDTISGSDQEDEDDESRHTYCGNLSRSNNSPLSSSRTDTSSSSTCSKC